jgi:hypothetical protein
MTCRSERGAVLVVTLMAMLLLSAIGAALVLATSTDVQVAANAGAATEAFYAADAVFERTLAELRTAPDFTAILDGSVGSGFVDGPPTGVRTMPDATVVDVAEIENLANCARRTPCSDSDMDSSLRDRPWGRRNPRWRLFSWGMLDVDRAGPALYVVALVADDPAESDDDPLQDGGGTGTTANPGAGVLLIRGEAVGRRGAHRVLEGTVVRHDLVALARWRVADPATRGPAPSNFPVLQVLAWREVR